VAVLSAPVPASGIKEVFLSSDNSRKFGSSTYKLKDLISEVQLKSDRIREVEMVLLQQSLERNRLRDDINLLKNQLEAEEQLRIQAESKSSLMHKELERLHKVNSEHNIEREDVKQKIKQIRMEIELIDASRSDSDDSLPKVQKVVAEIQADHSRTKKEVVNLKETNKKLTQRIAHERQRRDQLLRELSDYKQQLVDLTPKPVHIYNENELIDTNSYDGDQFMNIHDFGYQISNESDQYLERGVTDDFTDHVYFPEGVSDEDEDVI